MQLNLWVNRFKNRKKKKKEEEEDKNEQKEQQEESRKQGLNEMEGIFINKPHKAINLTLCFPAPKTSEECGNLLGRE